MRIAKVRRRAAEKDQSNRDKIHGLIYDALGKEVDFIFAEKVKELLISGKIPNVKIVYES